MTRDLTIRPTRNIVVKCSTAMWIAIAVHAVVALGGIGTLIWAVATYKAVTENRIGTVEGNTTRALLEIQRLQSDFNQYIYQRRSQ